VQVTLTSLEIVLGLTIFIFISSLIKIMPEAQRVRSRVLGLGLVMLTSIQLLFFAGLGKNLTTPFFCVLSVRSPKELFLL
jgi:predicted tellurium resistance membrane protein TerC